MDNTKEPVFARNKQIRRSKQLAGLALQTYALQYDQVRLLKHHLNTTFRVIASSGQERYILRVQNRVFQNRAEIQSEMIWLNALQQDVCLRVPIPVQTKNGDFVASVSLAGTSEQWHCVLLKWIDGRFFTSQNSLRPDHLQRVGTFMAQMHRYAERFSFPDNFTRKSWDYGGLYGGYWSIDPCVCFKKLVEEDRRVMHIAAQRLLMATQQLGKGPEVFGLIHGDLHQNNFLFHGDNIGAIDFDFCGWGYYLYDIAVIFASLQNWPQLTEMRAAFLRGYQRIRALPEHYEEYIDIFLAGRTMSFLFFLLTYHYQMNAENEHIAFQIRLLKSLLH